MEKALIAYYVMVDPGTNKRAKTVLAWALLYFVSPVDLSPDLIKVLGKLDDLGILTAALAMVSIYVGPEHVKKAQEKMKEEFELGPVRMLVEFPPGPDPANPITLKIFRGVRIS